MKTLILKDKYTTKIIKHKNIISIEADGNYCFLTLTNGERIITCKRLCELEKELPQKSFIRPHRSYIVNLKHIVEIDKRLNVIMLSNNKSVPISRRKKSSFL